LIWKTRNVMVHTVVALLMLLAMIGSIISLSDTLIVQ
jgi:hypothetical protein